MGGFSKRPRKQESDSSLQDESEEEILNIENEYDNDDNEYSGDSEEENMDSEDGARQNDNQRDGEMEDLNKELTDLRQQEQDILRNLKRQKDEDLLKGQAVKNQKALWDKTLELRFLLQKAFLNSNRLPKEPVRSLFCDSDSKVNEAYSELITSSKKTLDSLLELQEALLEKNPSIAQEKDGNSGEPHLAASSGPTEEDEWSLISEMHARIAPFRDKSIDRWQRKTQVTTGAAAFKSKLHAFNQNISEQVAAYMRDPSRMIKGMQQNQSTVAIFGTVPESESNAAEQELRADGDPDLLDDSEFYQQLLKEFFETFDATSETAFYAIKRMQTKKRKIVDRRASKSRKIRYHVHEKIVNFMAPQPMSLPPMAPTLFENLFGLKTQKPAPCRIGPP